MRQKNVFRLMETDQVSMIAEGLEALFQKRLSQDGASIVNCRAINDFKRAAEHEFKQRENGILETKGKND